MSGTMHMSILFGSLTKCDGVSDKEGVHVIAN